MGGGSGGRYDEPGRASREAAENLPDATPNYEDMSQEEGPSYRKGQKVRHDKFGVGTIMGVSGSGEEVRVEVVFGDQIRRTLLARFAKLQVVG
jgi:DNA helicase-2/ATP-dependent DNA helicase PcrA